MKKLCTLLLTAGLLTCNCNGIAHALDFKVSGAFIHSFDYISGGNFMSKTRRGQEVIGQQWAGVHQARDSFDAVQRMNLQLEAIASENLAATVLLEIGDVRYGQQYSGGALGTDGSFIKVRQAFLDWTVPHTDLKLRMGLQQLRLPGFALDSPVYDDDAAGIVASYKINDTVAMTAFWLRPYNDNFSGNQDVFANYMDNFDLGGLIVPLTWQGGKITPWIMAGAMGPNTLAPYTVNPTTKAINHTPPISNQGIDGFQVKDGLLPAAFSSNRPTTSLFAEDYSSLFWGGLTGQITLAKPLTISFDAIYGNVSNPYEDLSRAGWFGMLLAEYKMDWGTPGIYAWYFSGDDADPHNGSERLPYIATTNNYGGSLSSFGYRGSVTMGGGKGVLGTNPNGTWGIGARIKNMSFIQNLSHIFRVNYFQGTNHPDMAAYITGSKTIDNDGRPVYRNNTDFNSFGTYLTTADSGIEINFDTRWKITQQLSMIVETGYIHLWLDEGTWGKFETIAGNSLHPKDAWKASVHFIYKF